MAAGGIMQGARGGVDIPATDVDRVKSHLAKYYRRWIARLPGKAEILGWLRYVVTDRPVAP